MKIRIAPETELVMDPLTSVISKEKNITPNRSMIALIKKLNEAERAVDGLMDSLSAGKPLQNSWRGREKTAAGVGTATNFFYGLIAGLILSGAALLLLSVLYGGI
ncbi:MAG: tetrahydromethanopterin S-methyltransferase subunit B [Methanosarcinales archaeon]|nr:tetrahydromethanopterin S-methyltransferase subunit B [Methanosarcinales archaeon]